jgi:hypothetical protein
MMILTASQQFSVRHLCGGSYKAFIERQCLLRWNGAARPNWTEYGDAVSAWINQSSWVVNCPDCRESIIAEPGLPFFCPSCLNKKNSGLARPILWPENRIDLERVLLMRIAPETRNWMPQNGETIETLVEENKQHGEWEEE